MGTEFVRKKLDISGQLYDLYDSRQAGDHEDFAYYDMETLEGLRPQAEDFIKTVSNFVN